MLPTVYILVSSLRWTRHTKITGCMHNEFSSSIYAICSFVCCCSTFTMFFLLRLKINLKLKNPQKKFEANEREVHIMPTEYICKLCELRSSTYVHAMYSSAFSLIFPLSTGSWKSIHQKLNLEHSTAVE